MEIQNLDKCPPKNGSLIKHTEMGNIIEQLYVSQRNSKQTIQMLPGGEQYVILSSGEVVDIIPHESRSESVKNLRKTFARLRALINTNIVDVSHVRWITLTYAENMTDTERLYKDFEKFNKRFQYFCQRSNYPKPEYIVVMEPQRRGAWHAHLLYIFPSVAPFIPNSVLADIWGFGFVNIQALDYVDNVGAYLTAYLGDLDLSECDFDTFGYEIKEVAISDENGNLHKKRFVKGARLRFYPPKFNIYRHSRGIKSPVSFYVNQAEAETMVSGYCKTYERTLRLTDSDSNFDCIVNKSYYNKLRKS